jgi:hypothetical protein
MTCVTWCQFAGDLPDKTDPDSNLQTWDIILATFSNWFRNEILGMLSGEAPTYQTSGTYYIACCSTASTSAAAGTELSGGNYGRTAITFDRVSDIQRWNPVTLNSPLASAEWDPILSFALYDQATGGNYYAFGNLATALTIESGKAVQWPENQVIVGMGQ